MCYNCFVNQARSFRAPRTMLARHSVLLTLPSDGNRPLWSYHHTGTLPRLISFVSHSYENTGGVGVFFPFWFTLSGMSEGNSSPSLITPTLVLSFHAHANWWGWGCFLSGFSNRCIISLREHPPQRSRMPRPGLSHRKRNHHSRILPALPERSYQCLQPEIESRSRHESRRSRRPPGLAFSGRTILGPFRQRLGQPRHQIRTPPPGSFQLLSPRNCHSLRFVVARSANARRTPHPRRTHASFRRPERRAVQSAALDEARAPARQSSSSPARHQGGPLRSSFVRRCGVFRGQASGGKQRNYKLCRRRAHRASGERARGASQRSFRLSEGDL